MVDGKKVVVSRKDEKKTRLSVFPDLLLLARQVVMRGRYCDDWREVVLTRR